MLDTYWNDGSPKSQSRDYDDFVVSTERIGCATAEPPAVGALPDSADWVATVPLCGSGSWLLRTLSHRRAAPGEVDAP